jgi:hypothetical protein
MSKSSRFQYLLLERGSGFHFGTPPPGDLLRANYLESTDSKEVIAAVLAHAQNGNFGVFDHLLRLMQRVDSAVTWNACTNLLSYAAPYSTIRQLLETFHDEVFVRRDGGTQWYMCRILSGSKALWAVPVMLEILSSLIKDRKQFESIPVYLSYLLEAERGLIADGPPPVKKTEPEISESVAGFFDEEEVVEYDEPAYRGAVLATYTKLKDKLGAEKEMQLAVFEGEALSLAKVAERLLARLRADDDPEEIEIGRMILEAFTGIDCSSFFQPNFGPLQPLTAAAIVEDFLESGEATRFEDGVRYFFGRRIPD